jgi:hypothetical protein
VDNLSRTATENLPPRLDLIEGGSGTATSLVTRRISAPAPALTSTTRSSPAHRASAAARNYSLTIAKTDAAQR